MSGEITAVTTSKGGVLKTSIVSNLGSILAKENPDKRILLVDTDGQGNLAQTFGIDSEKLPHSLYDVYKKEKTFEDIKQPILENMDLIPSNVDLNELDYFVWSSHTLKELGTNPFHLLRSEMLKAKESYDYILIDTPPAYSLNVYNTLYSTDRVIVPLQPETYAINGLIQAIEVIKSISDKRSTPIDIAGVLATVVRSTTRLHNDVIQQARQYCSKNDINMFDTVINQSIKYAETVAYQENPLPLLEKLQPRDEQLLKTYYNILEELRHD